MTKETVPVEYWNAYSCGHYTRRSMNGSAGIAWCEVCRNYVGVITQRIDNLRASDVVGAQTKPGTRLPTHRTGGT